MLTPDAQVRALRRDQNQARFVGPRKHRTALGERRHNLRPRVPEGVLGADGEDRERRIQTFVQLGRLVGAAVVSDLYGLIAFQGVARV